MVFSAKTSLPLNWIRKNCFEINSPSGDGCTGVARIGAPREFLTKNQEVSR